MVLIKYWRFCLKYTDKQKFFFHASPHRFERPDYDALNRSRQNHDNGALGLWCAARADWISTFGAHLYEVAFENTPFRIAITDFQRACMQDLADEDFYRAWRDDLLASGYTSIEIVEADGHVDMLIILDFDAISTFRCIDDLAQAPPPVTTAQLAEADLWDGCSP